MLLVVRLCAKSSAADNNSRVLLCSLYPSATMDAQFYQWIREATDEQLQQLLSAVNLELQSRQAHSLTREQELRESIIRQWQQFPVRCVQPCSQRGQQRCFRSFHPDDPSAHSQTEYHRCRDHWGSDTIYLGICRSCLQLASVTGQHFFGSYVFA